jgi:putative hydrolase of the HAD superfamily
LVAQLDIRKLGNYKGFMISTIIFDLDDTLYDEIDYCRSGFRAVASYMSQKYPNTSAQRLYDLMIAEFESGNRYGVFNSVLQSSNLPCNGETVTELVGAYRDHRPTIKLPEESRLVLSELGSKYGLAMLTDGFLPAQRLKVQALGIESLFRPIIYTEELGRQYWKPSPVGFQKILSELGVTGSECVYIGDNEEKDFIAPNALGMLTVKLSRPISMHTAAAASPQARPARTIRSLTEFPALLASL